MQVSLDALLATLVIGGKTRDDLEQQFGVDSVAEALERKYIACDIWGCGLTADGRYAFNTRRAQINRPVQPTPQTRESPEKAPILETPKPQTPPVTTKIPSPQKEETMPKISLDHIFDFIAAKPHCTVTDLERKFPITRQSINLHLRDLVRFGKIQRDLESNAKNGYTYSVTALSKKQEIKEIEATKAAGFVDEVPAQNAVEADSVPEFDPELEAMHHAYTALRELPPTAVSRVLAWLEGKLIKRTLHGVERGE
jgi:predicted DNA-binding transcriptional regulator